MKPTSPLSLALWLSSASIISLLGAQEVDDSEIIVLDGIEANNVVSLEESILPTARPFVSLYGTEKSVIDTPRNVTIVSREQLDAIAIRDPRDFSKLTSSAYTQSNFGAPANPAIRGQLSDVLVNNMRRGLTNNGNGLPTNFNAVESVNILKGPPSVSVGVSQYVGGYVDLITKKPNFAENSTELTVTIDSEGLLQGQIDTNYVLSEQSAVRFSYTAEDTDNYYYDNHKRKTQALYAAFVWVPNDTYRLELSGEAFYADYTENWGWNRVTQDLIDHGTYNAGTVGVSTQSADLDDNATYGPFGTGTIVDGGNVQLSRQTRLLREGDDSKGYLLTPQAIQTWTPDSDTKIINNTMAQFRDRDSYSSYQYSEILQDNYSIENRTEYQTEVESKSWIHKLNFGLDTRFTHVLGINDYSHEPANYWDLSRPNSEIGVTDEFVFLDNPFTAFTGTSVPIIGERARGRLTLGRPGSVGGDYTGTYLIDPAKIPGVDFDPANGPPSITFNDALAGKNANNGDTNDSDVFQFGVFLQDDIELSDQWSFLIGGRLDFVHVETQDPLYDDVVAYLETYGAAGEAAQFQINNPARDREQHSEVLRNFNTSLVFKPTEQSALYATFNFAESAPIALGGGITVTQARNESTFVRQSTLYEVGYKRVFLDQTLFFNSAAFFQTRSDPVQGGGAVDVEASGIEVEANYQPNKRFYATVGYSYVRAKAVGLTGDFVAEAQPYNDVFNNVGLATGDTDAPGVPKHLFNFLMSYKLSEHFGLTSAAMVTSPIKLTYDNANNAIGPNITSAEIPWQYSVDLGAFYETERWTVRFNILNATDEENFGAVTKIYGNASVYVELPRRYELSLSYRF